LSARTPIIGANWKMNTTLAEGVALAEALVRRISDVTAVEVVVFPPFTHLEAVNQVLAPSSLKLGAQDVFWENWGAFTGEISPPMLLSVGAEYVITGHSERRRILGESSAVVNKKVRAALASSLNVILAVGETREERRSGQTEAVLVSQLQESLTDISVGDMNRIVIAYEPVWAIGTGDTATPEQAQTAHAFIRNWLAQRFDVTTAASVRIQYGGSVTAQNAYELLTQTDVDGTLVGGASLKPDEFAAIVAAATRVQAEFLRK
jgi:triosephosphate isomerase